MINKDTAFKTISEEMGLKLVLLIHGKKRQNKQEVNPSRSKKKKKKNMMKKKKKK